MCRQLGRSRPGYGVVLVLQLVGPFIVVALAHSTSVVSKAVVRVVS